MCGPHQVWPLRSECCGRGVPTKVVCAECMKMCCLGGKNSVVKGLTDHILKSKLATATSVIQNTDEACHFDCPNCEVDYVTVSLTVGLATISSCWWLVS